MTDKQQPDPLALADEAWNFDCSEYRGARTANAAMMGKLQDCATVIRKLHAELETLRAKLKTYEDLGDAADDMQLLRMGYAAARLGIESLRDEVKEYRHAAGVQKTLIETLLAERQRQISAKLNYSVLYVYASQHGIDYNSLCVAVQEALAQPAGAPQPSPTPQADNQPALDLDMAVMQLAESVGLIGPASRVHDLHAAIQRFHDLICVNATIKAAVMAADAIRGAATSARDYPPLPMQFACTGVFPVYSADQMRAYVDADRAMRVAQPEVAQQPGTAYAELPDSLICAVDQWFADNIKDSDGCTTQDVRELAEIFYGVTHEGGRESVDDALAIVKSFGPGIGGINDTYARQVLLAEEVERLRGQATNAKKTGELLMGLAVIRELTGTQQKGLEETIEAVRAAVNAQKHPPAPATLAVNDDLRDRLVAISEAIANQDDRAAQAMLREILKAPQADSQPAPQQEAQEPFAWHVCSVNSDGSLSLEHAAAWEEAAHEHINDAITEHDIEGAGSWVVRPAYHAPQPSPAAQGDALDAERYRWLRERSSTMFVNISINGEGAEIAATLDSAVDAARKQGGAT